MHTSYAVGTLLLFLALQTTLTAQVSPPSAPAYWEQLDRKPVVVEGFLWGYDKGRGLYVVYNGGTVNVSQENLPRDQIQIGRMVRVRGKFVKGPPHRPVPYGYQASRQLPEDRFAIHEAQIELIDQIQWPVLTEDDSEARISSTPPRRRRLLPWR